MYFETFSEFLQMGKHGAYVWSAYGISLALILLNLWLARKRNQHVKADIARSVRREKASETS